MPKKKEIDFEYEFLKKKLKSIKFSDHTKQILENPKMKKFNF